MSTTQPTTTEFVDNGAGMIGMLERELQRSDLDPDQRAIYTRLISYVMDSTARWVKAAENAEHYDAILFGASPKVLVHVLRKNLSPGQCVQLARMLEDW